ncbi:substrate-binding periplasmic protein [Algihabitans albus]|uniref:substrate-binding periplasmic protein n=1 Tax=Algihabitans albus TaxID=2164067 RepID=UPI000E5C8DA2|nr:transporter substrate-binding domain-containing protein [Algihabitans albus]
MRPLLLAFALLFGCLGPARAETPIRVVVDDWPPFGGEYLPNGGISLDVITTVLERAGYDVTTEILPFARILNGAQSGIYDVVGNLFLQEELQAYLTYSDPFYETEVRFVQQKGHDHVFTDVESLRPYSIAVGEGYLYEERFDSADDLNKVVVTTTIQGVRMVASGRVDLTLDSTDVIDYAIRTDDPGLADQIEYLPTVLTAQRIHMAVRSDFPGRDKLLADFNSVLADMRADGSLDRLLEKHRN